MKIKISTKDLEKYLQQQYPNNKNIKLKVYDPCNCEHPDGKHLQFILPDFFEVEIPDTEPPINRYRCESCQSYGIGKHRCQFQCQVCGKAVNPQVKHECHGQNEKQYDFNIEISRDDTKMDGFAAYAIGSIHKGTAKILINLRSTLIAYHVEKLSEKDFQETMITNLMHEFGHAMEDLFGKEFDHDFIDKATEEYLKKERPNIEQEINKRFSRAIKR